MEVAQESSATELSPRVPRSRQRWLIAFVLLVAVISLGYLVRSPTQEAQWLAGHWNRVETYAESQFEYDWIFELQGRVHCTNRFVMTGKTPSTETRKFSGQWIVRNGKLCVRIDRPVLRSLSHAGHQAQVAIENAVTGSNAKLADPDYWEGSLVQLSQDRFTVTWIDPAAPDKVQTPQMWSRVP